MNVTTMVAYIGMAGAALYGSSKAALQLLTQAWAAEYGASGVTANSKEERTNATFGFVLSRSEKGGQVVSLAGTAWTTTAWRPCGQ